MVEEEVDHQIEHLPDADFVHRVLPVKWQKRDGKGVRLGAFGDPQASVDWHVRATVEKSRARGPQIDPNGAPYKVAVLPIGELRRIGARLRAAKQDVADLSVTHAPLAFNDAHSLIIGAKPESVRALMAELAVVR